MRVQENAPFRGISSWHLNKKVMIRYDLQKVKFAFMEHCLTNTSEFVEVQSHL
jgi:hypothetical protein